MKNNQNSELLRMKYQDENGKIITGQLITTAYVDGVSVRTILGKIIDEINDHRLENRGRRPNEIVINYEAFEQLKSCNFFSQDYHTLQHYREYGFFYIQGVKCSTQKDQNTLYKIIEDSKDSIGLNVLINQ